MPQVNLQIESKTSLDKKETKNITHINPNATNAQLRTLSEELIGLTSNTYTTANRISENSVNNGGGAKIEPTLTVDSDGTITYNGDGQLGISLNNNLFGIIQNNEISAKDNEGFARNSFSGIILASEGTTYAAKSISFTVSK